MDIESMMWDSVVTQQCAPVVLQQLVEAELTSDYNGNSNDILKTFTKISNSASNSARQVPSDSSNERYQ
eukprot:5405807-Amphidinium_carterae.1